MLKVITFSSFKFFNTKNQTEITLIVLIIELKNFIAIFEPMTFGSLAINRRILASIPSQRNTALLPFNVEMVS